MSETAVVDQTDTTTEPGDTSTGGGVDEVIDESTVDQSTGKDIDKGETDKDLPPELQEKSKNLTRDYHAKTQKLAKKQKLLESENAGFKQDADFFRSLAKQPWFVEAYEAQKSGKTEEFSLSKEDFEEAQQSPDAMARVMRNAFETMGKSMFGNELGQTKQAMRELQKNQEIDRLSGKYPDFKSMFDSGELRQHLDNGVSFAAAYALAKLEDGGSTSLEDEAKAEEAAQKLLDKKKAAATNKGGVATPKGSRVVKAKSFEDAFDQILELRMKGITDVKVERITK